VRKAIFSVKVHQTRARNVVPHHDELKRQEHMFMYNTYHRKL